MTADLVFETSWEVCNKVGGIYAVLSTKAKTLHQQYGDNVIFVGPDIWTADNKSPFFIECDTPLSMWLAESTLPMGVRVRVGRWDVPGKPVAVLVDFKGVYDHKNAIYSLMWERYGVDSLAAYGDYDEACAFAVAAATVIESIISWRNSATLKVVAHFDEWTTGMGLLYLHIHMPQVATVFTTHATSIGRSICGNGKPLYDFLHGYYGDQMARELNMVSKHSLEKAAARVAHSFTTVSDVTARECEQLLERRPMVTPNAFEPMFVPSSKDYAAHRERARKRLLEVAEALIGEKFAADTMLIATSGRCEFRNKGIDAFLDSCNILRDALRGKKRKVIAFVLVPGWSKQPREQLLKAMNGAAKSVSDPVITHDIHNYDADVIYNKIHQLRLLNSVTDAVKVIYVPCYLNGDDGIFNLAYYDLLIGMDATVFPSYYEPWGYTPLESAALGVPTITTSLAGFGQWVAGTLRKDFAQSGVAVLERNDGNYEALLHHIVDTVKRLYKMPADEITALRDKAKATGKAASWKSFIKAYNHAYNEAMKKSYGRYGLEFKV